MLVIPSKASLLLIALAGCHHAAPDAVVLAPLASLTPGRFDQGNRPEHVVFRDQLTATVFKNLKRDSRYRIVSKDARLVCPSKAAEGIQGYMLQVRIENLMGDSAVATMERTCTGSGGTLITGERILLVRRTGKWNLDKFIDAFTMVPM